MALKQMAIDLMETDDPRIPGGTMGVGPPWQYVKNASKWEERGRNHTDPRAWIKMPAIYFSTPFLAYFSGTKGRVYFIFVSLSPPPTV